MTVNPRAFEPAPFSPRASAQWQAGRPLKRQGRLFREPPGAYFRGRWQERHPLNVPGPFYGAATDTGGDGPPLAPASLLVDELGQGFVWRQPRNDLEVLALMTGSSLDPFAGFGWDGDQHWTAELVRDWWRGRSAHAAQLRAIHQAYAQHPLLGPLAAQAVAYLSADASHDLRRYLFFLAEARYPAATDALPVL